MRAALVWTWSCASTARREHVGGGIVGVLRGRWGFWGEAEGKIAGVFCFVFLCVMRKIMVCVWEGEDMEVLIWSDNKKIFKLFFYTKMCVESWLLQNTSFLFGRLGSMRLLDGEPFFGLL